MTTALASLYAAPKPAHRNEDTRLSLEQTAIEKRFAMEYRPTYDFPGGYIDGYHRYLAEGPRHHHGMIDIGYEGWLLPADACKLYELAYFNPDILEIGTYRGLSSAVMMTAMTNAGHAGSIVTVDLDPVGQHIAREAYKAHHLPGRERVHFFLSDGTQFVRGLKEHDRRFPLVFVDHTHVYEPMVEICPLLHHVTAPGGFAIFHDYNDPRNANANAKDFGVHQAVEEHLDQDAFEFYGIFGACGLFRRRT